MSIKKDLPEIDVSEDSISIIAILIFIIILVVVVGGGFLINKVIDNVNNKPDCTASNVK